MKVATKEGRPYRCSRPSWRRLWPARSRLSRWLPRKTCAVEKQPTSLSVESLGLLPPIDWAAHDAGDMGRPGEAGAATRMETFLERGALGLWFQRDRPDHDGTSALSPHLHFGEVSPRRLWHAVREAVG